MCWLAGCGSLLDESDRTGPPNWTRDSDPTTVDTQDTGTESDTSATMDTEDTDPPLPVDTDTGEPPSYSEVPSGLGISSICAEWTFDGTATGWTLSAGLSVASQQNPGSTRFDAGDDPYLWRNARVDLDRCSLVDVVMKVTGAESTWEIFWERETDGAFAADRRRDFQLFSDEGLHRYVFDVSGHSDWNGTSSRIRIDPRWGAGTVELVSIRLMEPEPAFPPLLDLSRVTWLHTNVSGWPVTANLSTVRFSSTEICLDHDKTSTWTAVTIEPDVDVNANPWAFIWSPDVSSYGGQWYGATWEWMRPGNTCKGSYAVAGDHIKQGPYHPTSGWRASTGEVFYFMVSGLARSWERNQEERSDPVRTTWP